MAPSQKGEGNVKVLVEQNIQRCPATHLPTIHSVLVSSVLSSTTAVIIP